MASFKQYQTRSKANEGFVVYIPDEKGLPTKEWIRIRGMESEVCGHASRVFRTASANWIAQNGEEKRGSESHIKFVAESELPLKAALVIDWSFDEPCLPENVVSLLREAPFIGKLIEDEASKPENFGGFTPSDSEVSLKGK